MSDSQPKPDFTFEELTQFLVGQNKLDAFGFTVAEYAKVSGRSERWIRTQIAKSRDSDSPIQFVGRRTLERIDGTHHHVPVYSFPSQRS